MNPEYGIRPDSSPHANGRLLKDRRPLNAVVRWGAMVGGGALAFLGLSRKSRTGFALAAAGGLLAYRGATLDGQQQFHAESSFVIDCSPQQAFQFWRNFENLPRFMRNLQSVSVKDDRHSEWNAVGRFGVRIRWTAEIVDQKEDEWIVWRSLPDSDLDCRGSVHFSRAVGDRGTIVTVALQYSPPAGGVGKAFGLLFGKDPEFMLREDIRRFKALLEAGEVPNIEGQTHGPRSGFGKAIEAVYPEKHKPTEFEQDLQQLASQRSAS